MASSSRPVVGWQPVFKVGSEPLPATASIRTWAQSEEGRAAQSLTQGLLLPEDICFYAEAADESLTSRLQWYIIAVTFVIHFFLGLTYTFI